MNEQPRTHNPKSAFRWGNFLSLSKGSLRAKIIAWSFVPTAIILAAVALINFYVYQQVTEELVIERDRVTEELVIERNQELTRLSAGQLAAGQTKYPNLLISLARTAAIYQNDPAVQRDALKEASNRLVVFDAGVLILDTFGTVVAAEPERPEILGQDWSNRIYYLEVLRSQQISSSPRPVFSSIVADGPGGTEVIVVAVPITGDRGEFLGTMVGMFHLGATAVSGFYGDIVKLRIGESGSTYLVDGDGRVIYHSNTDRIGKDLGMQAVVQQALSGQTDAIRTRDLAGNDIVASFAPVPGTPWGLITEESWATLTSGIQGYEYLSQLKYLILLLVPGVVVPALVVAVGVRRIMRPIMELIGAAQEVAKGNFGQTITAQTGDEIEELARQFNLMAAQLQASYESLERRVADRTRELETLNAVAGVVSRSLDLDEILHDALDKTLQVLEIEAGGIFLLDVREPQSNDAREPPLALPARASETSASSVEPSAAAGILTIAVQRGFSLEFIEAIDGLAVGEGFSGLVAQSGQPLVVRDISTDPRLTRMAAREEGFHSLASVPLHSKEKTLGTLFAVTHGYREFTDQDVQLLTSIGHQLGVAIENARQRAQIAATLRQSEMEKAVTAERNRLARDLHDSVTQSLFAVTLYADAATQLVSSGQMDLVAGNVRKLRRTAKEALGEMRLLVFELRPPLLKQEGLVAALQARLESVEGRAGLETSLKVEGKGRLAPDVEEGLYRITQEALNNIFKHAHARSITVSLRLAEHPQTTILEIADDGIGFDPAAVQGRGGLGLRGMAERVEHLGGQLRIKSEPGAGTIVQVEVCQ